MTGPRRTAPRDFVVESQDSLPFSNSRGVAPLRSLRDNGHSRSTRASPGVGPRCAALAPRCSRSRPRDGGPDVRASPDSPGFLAHLRTRPAHRPRALPRRLLLHVTGPERTHAPSALDLLESGTLVTDQVDQARVRLDDLAIEGEAVQVATGLTAEAILDAARTWNADLIVMGTQGRQGFTRLMLGSVADAIVRGAEIPVMTVREGRKPVDGTT